MPMVINQGGNSWSTAMQAAATIVQALQASRQQGQAEQMQLMNLLAKQEDAQIQPVGPGEVSGGNFLDQLFGAGGQRTATGEPVFRVGGQQFKVGRVPSLGSSVGSEFAALLGPSTGAPTPAGRVFEAPLPNYTEPHPAPLTPPAVVPSPVIPAPTLTPPQATAPAVTPAFQARVQQIADRLGMDPAHLMAVMNFETGGTFSPSVRNGAGSGATGLIQFMPATAQAMGTSTEALARMPVAQQLEYVEKYLAPYKGKLSNLQDAYMAVLWPQAIGKSPETVLFREGTKAYQQNAGLDSERKGYVTVGDATAKVQDYAQRTGMTMAPSVAERPPEQRVAGPGALPPAPEEAAPPTIVPPPGGATAETPAPPTPTAEQGQSTIGATDTTFRLAQRQVTTAPDAATVSVRGVGQMPRAMAEDLYRRLQPMAALPATRKNKIEYEREKHKIIAELRQDQQNFLKERRELAAAPENKGYAGELRKARNRQELETIQAGLPTPDALTRAAHTGILAAARAAERNPDGTYTQAGLAHIRGAGNYYGRWVPADVIKSELEAVGVPISEKALETRTLEPIKTEAKREEQELMRPGLLETERQKADLTLEQKQREASDPTIRKAKADDAAAVAREQERVRARGTVTFLQSAQDVLQEEIDGGRLPSTATINDLSAPLREKAHAIEQRRAGQIEQAKRNILFDTKMTAAEAKEYINPQTGQVADEEMTPREALAAQMIRLSAKERGTVATTIKAKQVLEKLELLALGGTDTKGLINEKPGETIRGIFTADGSLKGRFNATVNARIATVKQDQELGRLIRAYQSAVSLFTPTLGRGVGGDSGHFTDADRAETAKAIANASVQTLGTRSLQDARETAKLQFRLIRDILESGLTLAMGPTGSRPPRQGIPVPGSPPQEAAREEQETPEQIEDRLRKDMNLPVRTP